MAAFVGREAELSAVLATLGVVVDRPRPAVGLLTGAAGVGKSRLLAEARAALPTAHTAMLAGFLPERDVPLAAAGPLLRLLGRVPEHGRRLDRLVLGFASGPLEPARIFEAAYRAVAELEPFLVVVDDLQWVDAVTLALLHYLLRAAEVDGHRLLFLAAARRSETVTGFADSLAGFLPADRRTTIEIGPLPREDAVRLARSLDDRLTPDDAEAVWRSAGGSPFWIEALTAGGAASDLDQLVEQRLEQTPDGAATILALIGMAGRPLGIDALAAMQRWSRDRVAHLVEGLERGGLVVVTSEAVRLAHELIREAVVRRLSERRRSEVHASLAEWMEAAAGDEVGLLLQALEHRAAAGLPVDRVATRLAGGPARRQIGADGFARLARIADEARREAPSVELEWRVAGLAEELGLHEEALARWSEVAVRVSGAERAQARLAASRAAAALGRIRDGWSLLPEVSPDPGPIRVDVLAHEARLLQLEHRMGEARERALLALDGARAIEREHPTGEGRVAYLRALVVAVEGALMHDEFDEMLALGEELIAASRQEDAEAHLRGWFWSGFALYTLGRQPEAETRLHRAWEEARREVFPSLTLEFGYFLTIARIAWGQLAEAEAIAAEAAALQRRVAPQGPRFEPWLRIIALSTGNWQRAAEALRSDLTAEDDPHRRAIPTLHLAMALSRAGVEASMVVRSLEEGRADAERGGCDRCLREILVRGADLWAWAGDRDRGHQWLEDWNRREPSPAPVSELYRERAAGILDILDGDRTAVDRVAASADAADGIGRRLEAAWTRLDLARLIEAWDRDRAESLYRHAQRDAAQMHAVTEVGLAGQGLRRLGVRSWRRGVEEGGEHALGRLTQRELEVARLIAEGASNPDIARSLFLSRKTVERHVSNILGKLELRNRVEVAALVSSTNPDT